MSRNVSAEPGSATKKCGTTSAITVLDVSGRLPAATPRQQPAATSGKKPVNPATIRGFNPQPEPPANPGAQFLPNPVLPAVK